MSFSRISISKQEVISLRQGSRVLNCKLNSCNIISQPIEDFSSRGSLKEQLTLQLKRSVLKDSLDQMKVYLMLKILSRAARCKSGYLLVENQQGVSSNLVSSLKKEKFKRQQAFQIV